jgi:N-acetylmuramoyl-L-alanine amidase
MLTFDKGAKHAAGHNNQSIGIELDYAGSLVDTDSPDVEDYKKLNKYKPDSYIYASNLNDPKFKFWPLYPREQLDGLVNICRAISKQYQINNVFGHDELYSYKMDPGPAFPITQFRERLGVKTRSAALQQTARSVRVRNMPGKQFVFLPFPEIPAGMKVSIINEYTDENRKSYLLISVLGTVKGNPWIVGWIEKEALSLRSDLELDVSIDHYLTTKDGGRFEIVEPHTDNYSKGPLKDYKYIIIHFTTGTRVESTIAHFRNGANKLSAHLLISSDGRIIQFLPFNRIAFHAGDSWWEGDKWLNEMSIGIELDNAGFLTEKDGNWYRKDVPIPKKDVVIKTHTREYKRRAWERFPAVQLAVLEKVVRALVDHYGGSDKIEMLGHDDINIANRLDPGPDFPMKQLRKKVFGRSEARYQIYTLDKKAPMYENVGGRPPDVKHVKHPADITDGSIVTFVREESGWTLIAVNRTNEDVLRRTSGWVRSRMLSPLGKKGERAAGRDKPKSNNQKKPKEKQQLLLKTTTEYYRKAEYPPSPRLPDRVLQKNPKIRIEEVDVTRRWALIVLLKFKGTVEGWVETKFITPRPKRK